MRILAELDNMVTTAHGSVIFSFKLLEQRLMSAAADEKCCHKGARSVGLNRVLVRITGRFYVDSVNPGVSQPRPVTTRLDRGV